MQPGSAAPAAGATLRTTSPGRLALAVGLLVLAIADLAVIDTVLLPRYFAGDPGGRSAPPGSGTMAVVVTPAPGAAPPPAPPPTLPVATAPPVAPSSPVPVEPAPVPAGKASAQAAEAFPDVLFARNTTWLSAPSRETLDKVAAALQVAPQRRVLLSGHSDAVGPPELNRWLSLSRARKAAAYLQGRGVLPTRIHIQSFGSTQPADTERTPAAWARNRRVEIAFQ